MTKKMVWTEVDTFHPEGKVSQLIEMLQSYITEYGADNCRVDYNSRPYEDSVYYAVKVQQPETDEQYNFRLQSEDEIKRYTKERELEEFKRLQALYGDN